MTGDGRAARTSDQADAETKEMPRAATAHWTYVQSLAWIRWRKPGIERCFEYGDAPERWQAEKFYPGKIVTAPGLPSQKVEVACDNAETQLNGAVRDGTIDVFALEGLEALLVVPAARHGLTLNLNSTASRGGRLVASAVVFDARQIQARWPQASRSTEARIADIEAAEIFLRRRMKASPGPGETKDTLRKSDELRGISDKAWDEVFSRIAREVNPDWSRPGRRPKAVDIVSPKSSRRQ